MQRGTAGNPFANRDPGVYVDAYRDACIDGDPDCDTGNHPDPDRDTRVDVDTYGDAGVDRDTNCDTRIHEYPNAEYPNADAGAHVHADRDAWAVGDGDAIGRGVRQRRHGGR